MQSLPILGDPAKTQGFDEVVESSLDDYRSGRALMHHLGADRLWRSVEVGVVEMDLHTGKKALCARKSRFR